MRYPNDEELLNLIENLEADILFAPNHLKGNILGRIDEITISKDIKSQVKWRSNHIYNLKVIAGIAAALALIFTLPLDFSTLSWQDQIYEQRIEEAKSKFENEQIQQAERAKQAEVAEEESEQTGQTRLDKIFKISTNAINDTGSMLLDKITEFGNLFER